MRHLRPQEREPKRRREDISLSTVVCPLHIDSRLVGSRSLLRHLMRRIASPGMLPDGAAVCALPLCQNTGYPGHWRPCHRDSSNLTTAASMNVWKVSNYTQRHHCRTRAATKRFSSCDLVIPITSDETIQLLRFRSDQGHKRGHDCGLVVITIIRRSCTILSKSEISEPRSYCPEWLSGWCQSFWQAR